MILKCYMIQIVRAQQGGETKEFHFIPVPTETDEVVYDFSDMGLDPEFIKSLNF